MIENMNKPKPNNCEVIFNCYRENMKGCVYFSGDELCKYRIGNYCTSAVATVNAATVYRERALRIKGNNG